MRLWPVLLLLSVSHVRPLTAEEPVPAADSKEENLTKSLSLPRNREVERRIRELKRAIAKKDWTTTSESLVELLGGDSADLIESDGVFRSGTSEAFRLLQELPAPARAVYVRLAEPLAAEQLQAAMRSGQSQSLPQIAKQFRDTPSGRRALELWSNFQHDLGQPPVPSADGVADLGLNENTLATQEFPKDLLRELPSHVAQWTLAREPHPAARDAIDATYHSLRQSGFNPYLSLSLEACAEVVVFSEAHSWTGLDPKTGRELWNRPLAGYEARWMRDPGSLSDPNRKRLFAMTAAGRMFGNEVQSRGTTDGRRFYIIESIVGDDSITRQDSEDEVAFPANRLVALDPASGEPVWVFDGEPAGELFFAGPPTVSGGRLYVLSESRREQDLSLMVLESASGRLLQQFVLAHPAVSVSGDRRRQGQACPLWVDQHSVFIPTAAGAVIKFDLLWEEICWARRYAREDVHPFLSEADQLQLHQAGFQWWNSWQEIQLRLLDDRVVFVSPEADSLFIIRKETGELLATVPRNGAVWIASADAERGLVLLEKSFARSIDPTTGAQRWRKKIPQPAGRGQIAGEDYIYPVQEQGVARLSLRTGDVQQTFEAGERFPVADGPLVSRLRPRNLIAAGGGLYELAEGRIDRLQSPQRALMKNPAATSLDEVFYQIERLNVPGAIAQLRKQLSQAVPGTAETARRLLLSLLTSGTPGVDAGADQDRILSEIRGLAANPHEHAAWRQMRALTAMQRNDWETFLGLWLTAPAVELDEFLAQPGNDSRTRLDCWFQQEWEIQFQRQPLAEQQRLAGLIESRIAEMLSHQEDVWLLLQRLGRTRWGQELVINHPPEVRELSERLQLQLRWLAQAERTDSRLAAGACWRLVQQYQSQRKWLDASNWLERLSEFPSITPLPGGRTVAQEMEETSHFLALRLNDTPAMLPWPDRPASVKHRSSGSSDVYFSPVPFETRSDSLLSRMMIEVDAPAHRAVRFNASGWSRPWLARLPPSMRSLRQDGDLVRGWGFEEVLLLQVGTELFGMTPLNLGGNRANVLLWPPDSATVDTLGDRDNLMLTFLQENLVERPGYPQQNNRRLDEFRHRAIAVGPVRSGYFCFQQRGMLVACETATGRELWRRYDLPPRAEVLGDDEYVAVIAPESSQWFLYRAGDGRFLAEHPWHQLQNDVLESEGLRILLARGDERRFDHDPKPAREDASPAEEKHVSIECLDLTAGKILWHRDWPAGSIPFHIDHSWLGMLEPSGNLEFVQQLNGETVALHKLAIPDEVARICCSVAPNNVIVVISGPVEDAALLEAPEMIRPLMRRPLINGVAHCFRRDHGQKLWEAPLGEAFFPLDQPDDLPVFVTIASRLEKTNPVDAEEKDATTSSKLGLCCFDRRNGQLLGKIESLGETAPNYSLVGNREQLRIRLHTTARRMEIDFSAPNDEPAGKSGVRESASGKPGN
jgi:outer membrane protein assembly factor BamB